MVCEEPNCIQMYFMVCLLIRKGNQIVATSDDTMQRLAILETNYQHLATKADLERLARNLVVAFIGIWLTSIAVLISVLAFILNSMTN